MEAKRQRSRKCPTCHKPTEDIGRIGLSRVFTPGHYAICPPCDILYRFIRPRRGYHILQVARVGSNDEGLFT